MAVLPKKFSKKGPISPEDYLIYMSDRIEFYARNVDRRLLSLENENLTLKKKNEESEAEIVKLKDEILVLKELLEG